MFRTRLASVALASLAFLPGCGLFFGDRPRICDRCDRGTRFSAQPVSYPMESGMVMGDGGCGGSIIPPGTIPYGNAPILPGPGPIPQIPKSGIGIEEKPGTQFDPDKVSRPVGPALFQPAVNK